MNYEIHTLNKEMVNTYLPTFISLAKEIVPREIQYWGEEHFLSDLPGKWEFSVGCFNEDKLLGFIISTRKAEDRIHINKMAVDNTARSMGIGSEALKKVEETARNRGVSKISLYTNVINEGAKQFYERNGYHVVETIPSPETTKHYMLKEL